MVTTTDDGTTLFRLHRPDADRVALCGSFTGWGESPVELSRAGGGWWEARVELEPGDYEFQYVVDTWTRIADYAATGVKLNRFGQWVSLLTVEPQQTRKTDESPVVIGRIGVPSEKASRAA